MNIIIFLNSENLSTLFEVSRRSLQKILTVRGPSRVVNLGTTTKLC